MPAFMLHAMQGAPHLPPFSHTEFLEGLAQHALPSILTERFGNQVMSRAWDSVVLDAWLLVPECQQQVLCMLSWCSEAERLHHASP